EVGNRHATAVADQCANFLGHTAAAFPASGPTEVVNNDPGALLGKLQRMAAADAMASAGDERNLALQQSSHVYNLSELRMLRKPQIRVGSDRTEHRQSDFRR